MKAAELFVKALENEGVEYIFGIPGEENLDFLEALRSSSIKLVVTRHEQAAGFMAATLGRLTGRAGVCLSTLGPGATNLATAAAYAQLGGMPIVMVTGQKPIKTSKQGQFQIVDIVELMTPVTKYARQIVDANKIPSLIREAFRQSQEERPGAVHLEFPEDVAEEQTQAQVFNVSSASRAYPSPTAIKEAAEMIQSAKKPLILIGAGANRYRVRDPLCALIDKSEIPFFTTQMGKGVVDERNEHYLGCAALSSGDYIHKAIEQADLIINVGHDIIEKPPFFMQRNGTKVIHINYFSAVVDEVYFPQLEIVGDIAYTLQELVKHTTKNPAWNFDYFYRVKNQLAKLTSQQTNNQSFPVQPQVFVKMVREIYAEDDIVTLDNGIYKIWFARNYPAYEPNTLLLDNALASMGAGLPSAMAAKLVAPDKRVLSVCGDGGFMMNSQELETAVRLGLDLTIIILNDNAYGMIKWKQSAMGLPDFGLDYNNPDFVQYAESYGATGYRAESYEHLHELMVSTRTAKGVHLIELPVDYSVNQDMLIDQLKAIKIN